MNKSNGILVVDNENGIAIDNSNHDVVHMVSYGLIDDNGVDDVVHIEADALIDNDGNVVDNNGDILDRGADDTLNCPIVSNIKSL